jgi:hypothetical protein
MIENGEFKDDPEGQQDDLNIIQDLINNFGNTLRGLTAVETEKVINAAIGAVWNALEKATGLALPRP